MTWRQQAACADEPTEVFYDAERFVDALRICARCAVIDACAAAGAHELYGVWGGTTPAERGVFNGIRTKRRAAARRRVEVALLAQERFGGIVTTAAAVGSRPTHSHA